MFQNKFLLICVLFIIFQPINIIQATNLDFTQKEFHILYTDENITSHLLSVDVEIYNITDLQEYSIIFSYDNLLVEYVYGQIHDGFYDSASGILGTATNGILVKPYTGTSAIFTYYFNIKKTGNTSISLEQSMLRDSIGRAISFETNTCQIEITQFDEYIESLLMDYRDKLREQENQILVLRTENIVLLSNYTIVQNEQSEIELEIKRLQEENSELLEKVEVNQSIPGNPIVSIFLGLFCAGAAYNLINNDKMIKKEENRKY